MGLLLLLRRRGTAPGSAPVNTSPPIITGTPTVGSTLLAAPGTWAGSPAPVFTYQWQRDAAGNGVYTSIIGATGNSYLIQPGDTGDHLRVVVTATNASGNAAATATTATTVTGAAVAGRIAAYPVAISWGQVSSGLFTFGLSTFGGPDTLAAASWSAGFAGPYDKVTADVREFAVTRGRDNDLTTVRAGTLNLNLKDTSGVYNPENPASPIYAFLDTDKPVRIQAALPGGATFPLYYGFITDFQADPSGRGTCVITAVDFLDKLDRAKPVIAPLPAGSTTGQIIAAILDWFNWTDPALRNIGTGDIIFAAWSRADGSRTGLELISELLQAERGILFAAASGAVTYIPRLSRYAATPAGALSKVMTGFPIGKSNANIVNQWTVQRTDMAGNNVGVPQTWPDPAAGKTPSQVKHGVLSDTLTTPFLNNDGQALGLAQFLITKTSSGLALVYDVPINIADAATMVQVLSRDLGDRETMTLQPRNMAQFTSDFFIESISHAVSSKGQPRHTAAWRVSAATSGAPFRFGSSLMGGTDLLYY